MNWLLRRRHEEVTTVTAEPSGPIAQLLTSLCFDSLSVFSATARMVKPLMQARFAGVLEGISEG